MNEKKLVQKEYKSRHDWLRIMQEIQIDHTTSWYMHKPESILEIDTHKIPLYFDIQTPQVVQWLAG